MRSESLCHIGCRAPAGVLFRPYDLLVTTREEAEHEYFTISATGVMHIKKGEQSTFTSLGDWMKDEAMFNLISKIKYFRTYLIGRCFRRWHKVCLACLAVASTCEVDKSSCHRTCWDMSAKPYVHLLYGHVASLAKKHPGF